MTFALFKPDKDARTPVDVAASETQRQQQATSSIVPIGWPLSGCGFFVLDPDSLMEIPPVALQESGGVGGSKFEVDGPGVGEILIHGANLAVGYLGRSDLNAASFVWLRQKGPSVSNHSDKSRFVPRQFEIVAQQEATVATDAPLIRCFRTGDFGYVQASDNALCFVGRRDQQVKVRGQRVDLLEVEANLRGIPGVDAAAVALLSGEGDGSAPMVAAYVIPPTANLSAIRTQLAGRVAQYAIPAIFLHVEALPLLGSGKLDRAALKRPLSDPSNPAHQMFVRTSDQTFFESSATEVQIGKLWIELGLIVPPPGAAAEAGDFFACGGDSLRLVALASRIRAALAVDIQLLQLAALEMKSVRAMADLVDSSPKLLATGATLPATGPFGDEGALVDRYLSHHGVTSKERIIEEVYALSTTQQGILFHSLMNGKTMYSQQSLFSINGALHLPRFKRAWEAVMSKYSLLRAFADTEFLVEEQGGELGERPALVILAPKAVVVPITVLDWTHGGPEKSSSVPKSGVDVRGSSLDRQNHRSAPDSGNRRRTSTDFVQAYKAAPVNESALNDLFEAERRRGVDLHGLGPRLKNINESDSNSIPGAPLFRLLLVRIGSKEWRLSLVIHHLSMDGWSLELVFQELASVYANDLGSSSKVSPLPEVRASFKSLVEWEATEISNGSATLAASQKYWANLMRDWRAPPRSFFSGLQSNTAAPPDQLLERQVLDTDLAGLVNATAQKHGLTVNALVHGAWAVLQAHKQESSLGPGENEVVVYGCNSSGRSAPIPGVEGLVGPVLRTFPVVVTFSNVTSTKSGAHFSGGALVDPNRPFTAMAQAIHFQLFQSMAHEVLPLAMIKRLLPENSASSTRQLFETILNFEPEVGAVNLDASADPGLKMSPISSVDRVGYPLTLRATVATGLPESAHRMSLVMTSEEARATTKQLNSLLSTFVALLRRVCDNPLATPRSLRSWLREKARSATVRRPGTLIDGISGGVEVDGSGWFPLTPVSEQLAAQPGSS